MTSKSYKNLKVISSELIQFPGQSYCNIGNTGYTKNLSLFPIIWRVTIKTNKFGHFVFVSI